MMPKFHSDAHVNKYLFLDVDGVLNRFDGTTGFEGECLKALKSIVDSVSGLQVVLSSSWRIYEDHPRYEWIFKLLTRTLMERCGLKLHQKSTPQDDLRRLRSKEILMWISDNAITPFKFAILDDIDQAFRNMPEDVKFQPNCFHGLDEEMAASIINHLNSKENIYESKESLLQNL